MNYRKGILIGFGALPLLGARFLISEHVRGRQGLARRRKETVDPPRAQDKILRLA